MSYDVILFDLDGTLTDSAEGIINSVVYALERMGIPYTDKRELRRFVGPPLQDAFRDYYGLSEDGVTNAVRTFREYFTEKGIYENAVYDGVPEMLDALQKAGYTLAVATSKPEAFAEQILAYFGLSKYFTVVAGASMGGTSKPIVIRKALQKLGTELKKTISAAAPLGNLTSPLFKRTFLKFLVHTNIPMPTIASIINSYTASKIMGSIFAFIYASVMVPSSINSRNSS